MHFAIAVIVLSLVVTAAEGQLQPTRACGIQIVVDNFLWNKYLSDAREYDKEEQERVARFNVASLAGRLVSRANQVLSSNYLARVKYKLILQDLQIEKECGLLCEDEVEVEDLLNSFSYTSRDPHCLSYLLTFRNFKNGKLGLAYTASPFHGGVCETFRSQKEEFFGYEREVNKSLNTGVVSFNRNGRQVSEEVAVLTFSHEIGHSFGAPHDPEDEVECRGSEQEGTFLMHGAGSLGTKRNNMVFSPCSLESMSSVLSSLEIREGGTCWTLDIGRGTCGNSVVEVWEECDCGVDPVECARECCVPAGDPLGRQPCKLVEGAQCSPSEGLCCNSKCEYSSSTVACSKTTECTEETKCTGKNSYCPLARSIPDSTPCAAGSKVCRNGKCEGSICPSLGMLPCTPPTLGPEGGCTEYCHTPYIQCTPANISFPDGTECSASDLYGYCGGGVCRVGAELRQRTWVVGVAIAVAFYLLFMFIASWIYCRYCRRRRVTLLPARRGKRDLNQPSSEHSEDPANMIEHYSSS